MSLLFGSSFWFPWFKNCHNFLSAPPTLDIEWRGNNSPKRAAKSGLPWRKLEGSLLTWKQRQTAESSIFARKLSTQVENVPERCIWNLAPLFARTCQQQIAQGNVNSAKFLHLKYGFTSYRLFQASSAGKCDPRRLSIFDFFNSGITYSKSICRRHSQFAVTSHTLHMSLEILVTQKRAKSGD